MRTNRPTGPTYQSSLPELKNTMWWLVKSKQVNRRYYKIFAEFLVHWGFFAAFLGIVLWQIYLGITKFFANPIATKTYTEHIITPHITICHDHPKLGYALDPFNIDFESYENEGIFVNSTAVSGIEVFNKSTQEFYYFIDGTGRTPLKLFWLQ